MTDAQRVALRSLLSELSAFARRRETDPTLQNRNVARRVRAQVAELEWMLADDEGVELGARTFQQLLGESRALMEDDEGPLGDGRIPPEDSGPVRLQPALAVAPRVATVGRGIADDD